MDWNLFWEWSYRISAVLTIVSYLGAHIRSARIRAAPRESAGPARVSRLLDFLVGRPGHRDPWDSGGGPPPVIVGLIARLGVLTFIIAASVRWLVL